MPFGGATSCASAGRGKLIGTLDTMFYMLKVAMFDLIGCYAV